MTDSNKLWNRFQEHYTPYPTIGLAVDLSRMNFSDDFLSRMEPQMQKAFAAMKELESGSIANPDEDRMVGHYWLRNPALAPSELLANEITAAISQVKSFSAQVHRGQIKGADGPFQNVLAIGMGGSALGPQFVGDALGHPSTDKVKLHFLDNTDPDGIDKVLAGLEGQLGRTLCLVISKSGGTKETRNGMLEAAAAYQRAGLNFSKHAVAITGHGSQLHTYSADWLERFPMWDWVGGRTSQTSTVGLLPAALQGIDIDQLLAGAKACDEITRSQQTKANPAAQLALMWYHAGNGRGSKDMVVLPYKDRLLLFSRYLQQLIMESIGKERDVNATVVNQGIAVYGNKGSTDQHAYVQQLREGLNNFFVTFVEVLKDRETDSLEVEPGVTAGDYLTGFFLGTRTALHEKNRESLTLTIDAVTPFAVGVLIALFERAVGFYGSLIHINAYHQPGVEAGKKAAGDVIATQLKILTHLKSQPGKELSCVQIASATGCDNEIVFKICEHLSANPSRGITRILGSSVATNRYRFKT